MSDDIKSMAREAGLLPTLTENPHPPNAEQIGKCSRFAALVRAQALEDAARECERIGESGRRWPDADEGSKATVRAVRTIMGQAGETFSAAIRSLATQEAPLPVHPAAPAAQRTPADPAPP